MASLRDIRRKIKSVKNTQQITKAMKMVAARLQRDLPSIIDVDFQKEQMHIRLNDGRTIAVSNFGSWAWDSLARA